MNETLVKVMPQFEWSEPPDCSSPRGWCSVTPETHPDREKYGFDYFVDTCGGLGVGNYLDYTPGNSRGPNGETIHVVAYFHHCAWNGCASEIRLGYCWVNTIQDAKDFIEGNVRAYLGFPRDGKEVTQ